MSTLVCWNCGEDLTDVPLPISRQASCPKCFNELHCCRLCIHYDPNTSTSCFDDRADTPLQKENSNFCEFFDPQEDAFQSNKSVTSNVARGGLDSLFGKPEDPSTFGDDMPLSKERQAKNKLDDLFE
jgi:hypothetical protein